MQEVLVFTVWHLSWAPAFNHKFFWHQPPIIPASTSVMKPFDCEILIFLPNPNANSMGHKLKLPYLVFVFGELRLFCLFKRNRSVPFMSGIKLSLVICKLARAFDPLSRMFGFRVDKKCIRRGVTRRMQNLIRVHEIVCLIMQFAIEFQKATHKNRSLFIRVFAELANFRGLLGVLS